MKWMLSQYDYFKSCLFYVILFQSLYLNCGLCIIPLLKRPLAIQSVGNTLDVPLATLPLQSSEHSVQQACINLAKHQRSCQDTITGLLNLVLDPQQFDGQVKLTSMLHPNGFVMNAGKYHIKEIKLENMKLPLETLDETCFAIRVKNSYPTVVCAASRDYRNYWMNNIHQAFLCKKNSNLNGYLPLYPSSPLSEKKPLAQEEEEEPPAVNIFLDQAPHLGLPELLINGHPLDQIIKEEKHETSQLVDPHPTKVTIDEIMSGVETDEIEKADSETPKQLSVGTPSLETLLAINGIVLQESKAEKLQIPFSDAPPYGYLKLHLQN